MAERILIGIKRMLIFDNGDVEIQDMPMDFLFDELSDLPEVNPKFNPKNVSERAAQILRVIEEVNNSLSPKEKANLNLSTCNNRLTEAIKIAARDFSVTTQTIHDKIGRQLGGSKLDFSQDVLKFFVDSYNESNFKDSTLYKKIINNVSKNAYDKEYVDYFFTNILQYN